MREKSSNIIQKRKKSKIKKQVKLDLPEAIQRFFEKALVKRFDFKQLIIFFEVSEKILWGVTGATSLVTLYSAFSPLVHLSPLLIIVICITTIFLGSLAYKYSMDLASRESALKQDPKTKIKVQEKRIKAYLYLIASNFYIAVTFFLTVELQPLIYTQLATNQLLNESHAGFMPSALSKALWFNYNHLPYALLIMLPALLPASLIVYTQTFELFIKMRPLFDQWGQSRYFKSNTFDPVIENRGAEHVPYVRIGLNVATQSDLYLSPSSRAVGIHIVGPMGTGKTAAIMHPVLRQDAYKVFMYWHDYAEARRKFSDFKSFEKYWFVEERNGQYINGWKVIDPSNSLASDMFSELLAMGVPREAITYLNPPDPLTDAMQAYSGKLEASVTTNVSTLMELVTRGSTNPHPFFTAQAQTYLENALFLVKFSSEIPNPIDKEIGNPSYDEIFEVILLGTEDIRYQRMLALEKFVAILENRYTKEAGKPKVTPQEEADFEDLENRYKIAKTTLRNWKSWLEVQEDKSGKVTIIDKMDNNVDGLRVNVARLAQKTGIRRILTRKTTFDFDVLMKFGGFLIVNTSTEELGVDAPIVGKLVSMNYQNAVMRRMNNIDRGGQIKEDANHNAWFSSADDEKPPYLTSSEPDFMSNSRKYKAMGIFGHQTNAQFDLYLDKAARDTLLTGLRNEFVYQDLNEEDAKHYSTAFGNKLTIDAQYSKQVYDEDGNVDGGRTTARETIVEKPNASPDDLVTLPQFYMAGRYFNGKEEEPFVLLRAYPFFEEKLQKPAFNRDDFDLWYADVQEALENAKSKNDVDAFAPESVEIIRQIEERQKAESLMIRSGKDDFRKELGQQIKPQEPLVHSSKAKQKSLEEAINSTLAVLDKEPYESNVDSEKY
ncbi:TraM recognition domain-containing protein [Lactococcus allomyrinae]|uniref:TraD/TraG TraM recognition site domain-containing protein n=1 Tax=Lactococcus allomyrinae TaxID=2419773 RepID=A0A387B825_9LACT|nr:TraM recognition domain-containing protein [Lactococcus allomyrinae]AYF99842.1 hypothetical protein D7I46_01335 [Lactococcus allomyrinae]